MKKKKPSARCVCCPYIIRLRKDGTVQKHTLFVGHVVVICEGSRRPPKREP